MAGKVIQQPWHITNNDFVSWAIDDDDATSYLSNFFFIYVFIAINV